MKPKGFAADWEHLWWMKRPVLLLLLTMMETPQLVLSSRRFYLPLFQKFQPSLVLMNTLHSKTSKAHIITIQQRKCNHDCYMIFGQASYYINRGISEVCVCPVTRIAYVAQNASRFHAT